jgi:hypothetical protein
MAKQVFNPAAERQTDSDLVAALIKLTQGYRDGVPMFQIEQPDPKDSIAKAQGLLNVLWPQFGDCSPFLNVSNGVLTAMRLPAEGRMDVFHPSGAIAAPKAVWMSFIHPAQSQHRFVRSPCENPSQRTRPKLIENLS